MRVDAFEWVIVSGGFHSEGGMDRANAALARHLVAQGATVHLIGHRVDAPLLESGQVHASIVPRYAGLHLTGDFVLDRSARRLVRRLRAGGSRVLVIANGGNCGVGDVNWVHAVHHAWPCRDEGAPAWFRAKNRLVKASARWRERRAIGRSPVVIANSERTRRDIVDTLGVDGGRVHTVYLGSDPAWTRPDPSRREAMRRKLCQDPARPMVAFVGALGHDTNKGIDRLLEALGRLTRAGWCGELVAAGSGDTRRWQALAAKTGVVARFAGQTRRVDEILDAADLLVSPVHYEAYGLAVHEAVCRGVPVVVSRSAGVTERLPAALHELFLHDPEDVDGLVSRIRAWAAAPQLWRERTLSAAAGLRAFTDEDMAAQIVSLCSPA